MRHCYHDMSVSGRSRGVPVEETLLTIATNQLHMCMYMCMTRAITSTCGLIAKHSIRRQSLSRGYTGMTVVVCCADGYVSNIKLKPVYNRELSMKEKCTKQPSGQCIACFSVGYSCWHHTPLLAGLSVLVSDCIDLID